MKTTISAIQMLALFSIGVQQGRGKRDTQVSIQGKAMRNIAYPMIFSFYSSPGAV